MRIDMLSGLAEAEAEEVGGIDSGELRMAYFQAHNPAEEAARAVALGWASRLPAAREAGPAPAAAPGSPAPPTGAPSPSAILSVSYPATII